MQVIITIFWGIYLLIQFIFGLYLLIPFLNLLCYGFLRLFRVKPVSEKKPFVTDKEYEFGVIITAHQDTQFIFPIADSLLKQTYRRFYVYVVADDCDISSLHFQDPRIAVLRPEEPLHSKIKSIHFAIEKFRKRHDAIIILDADNLLHPRFMEVMNAHFQKGYRVVQADFKPKNTDSVYARMDSIGDMFNFFLEREMRMRLNLSASIWGAGAAIDYDLYNQVNYSDFLGGFDKKLQSHLVRSVKRIAFAPEAILFDEKIGSGKSLEKQRTRWISSYFKYFKESFDIFWDGLKKLDFNLAYFGFITLRPPLFIVFGVAFLSMIFNYFIDPLYALIWPGVFFLFLVSFVGIVAMKGKSLRFLKPLVMLPFFVLRQVSALLKMNRAKKSFLKTQHSKVLFIDEVLKAKT